MFFLDRFKSYLRDHTATEDGIQRDTRREIWMETQSVVEALLLPEYYSYDHLAKEVWMHGPDEDFPRRIPGGVFPKDLARIKVLMSVYYFFEQVRNKSVDDLRIKPFEETKDRMPASHSLNRELKSIDTRHLNFLKGLYALGEGSFPRRVHLLSWNYDVQLQMAYSQLFGEPSLIACMQEERLNVHPGRSPKISFREPNLVYINGVAGLINNLNTNEIRLLDYGDHFGSLNLAELIARNQPLKFMLLEMANEWSIHETFSFAWEDHWSTRLTHKYLNRFGSITRDVVVIGYSFPPDNRRTDKIFFKAYMGLIGLNPKRVYLVSPDPDPRSLIELLDELRPQLNFPPGKDYRVSITLVPVTDRFPLPNELDALVEGHETINWAHVASDPFVDRGSFRQ